MCQDYLLEYSNVYRTLFVHSRTVYVHIRTTTAIPISTLLCVLTIQISEKVSLL